MKYYHGKIKEIIQQSADVKTVRIDIDEKIDFIPGQFVMLEDNGIKRAFSICSTPGKKYVEITFKVTGKFSQLLDKKKVGDAIKVRGPYGTFTLDNSEKPIAFVTGGVGITPFISMLRHLKEANSKREVTLIYSARTPNDFVYIEELKKICRQNNVKCTFTVTRAKWEGINGRITKNTIIDSVGNIEDTVFYICGNAMMVSEISRILLEMSVEKNRIRFETW